MMKRKSNQPERGGNNSRQGDNNNESGMDNDLHELFLDELADVYNAEQQLTKALPKMAKAAESDELREAFESHLEETQEHINRLEQLAETLDETLKKKVCKAMKGLVEEGQEIMTEQKGSSALDAGLIAAAQKVEHYEIATYGTLAAWAEQMGHQEAVELLQQTLEEENATDEKLTSIAETLANQKAEQSES
jgi:ferritin-like metal-binding protein YciE